MEKKRVEMYLTKTFIDALERLVKEGFYMDRQTAIREALRRLFVAHKIPPFYPKVGG